jgi:hypothetical protein
MGGETLGLLDVETDIVYHTIPNVPEFSEFLEFPEFPKFPEFP